MKERSGKRSISGLAGLLLLGVFAAGMLSVLLTGAGVYQRLIRREQLAYDSRTGLRYVETRLRQVSEPAAVTVSAFGDGDGLLIAEQIDGETYWTRIYCQDGWLMELFAVAGAGLVPQDGEKIVPLQQLTLTRDGDLFWVEIIDGNGTAASVFVQLRGGEGAAS